MTAELAPNYQYWYENGRGWWSEYQSRKKSYVYFHLQEIFISEYVHKHAPRRVLEYGCGVGRHLKYLSKIDNVDVFGFDQSPTMVAEMLNWSTSTWIDEHVKVGKPAGPLPFDDRSFDLVFTCEVLIHTRAEDLETILAELERVCRGVILHIEPDPSQGLVEQDHGGCWAHDLSKAYRERGRSAKAIPKLFQSQSLLEVAVDDRHRDNVFSDQTHKLFCDMEAALSDALQGPSGSESSDIQRRPEMRPRSLAAFSRDELISIIQAQRSLIRGQSDDVSSALSDLIDHVDYLETAPPEKTITIEAEAGAGDVRLLCVHLNGENGPRMPWSAIRSSQGWRKLPDPKGTQGAAMISEGGGRLMIPNHGVMVLRFLAHQGGGRAKIRRANEEILVHLDGAAERILSVDLN